MTNKSRRHLRLLCLAGTMLSCGMATPAIAQTATALPDVDVHSDEAVPGAPANAVTVTKQDLERHEAQSSDLADILTRLPGVSAYGAGGFSSLPSIRGLDNQRVGILVDGVPIDYACPNNMNPPLSYTDPQTVGSVSVVTGVSPVSLGGDTIGGSILVQTAPPKFAKPGETLFTGRVSDYYRSNGDAFGGAISATVASNNLSLTYNGSFAKAQDYDGGGHDGKVRSTEYEKTDHSLNLAAQTSAGLFQLSGGIQYAPYEGFPNQYMDMTKNTSWFVNGRYQGYFGWGNVDFAAHYRHTSHEMNFLADKGGTADGGMPMDTRDHGAGYTLKVSLPISSRDTINLGSEFQHQWLNDWWPPVAGSMMMGPDAFVNINRAHRNRLGTYAEWQADWSSRLTTTVGVRNDQVWMNTGAVQPYGTGMMQMDDNMAAAAFNAVGHRRHDSNWSGSAIAHYQATPGIALDIGYAHKVRSPTIYERYTWGRGAMASQMIGWFGDGNGYVGNLDLKPERADTISGAVTFSGADKGAWSVKIAPYLTHVSNYIDVIKLGDIADMMGMPSGFSLLQFANREARFYGVDASGDVRLWRGASGATASLTASASWLHGENLADHDPLYHQMPFNGTVAFQYQGKPWDARLELQAVADKTRVDPRRVEPKTDGYTLVNVGGGYTWRGIRLGVDVSNLFGTAYDLPLGGLSLGDYGATDVLRPASGRGRSVSVELSASF
jgi:iron complex outermembrane receptor protein